METRFRFEETNLFPTVNCMHFLKSILVTIPRGGGIPEKKNRKLSHPLISTRDETFRGGKSVHVSSSLPRLSLISAVKWSGAVKIFAYRVTGASVFSRFDRSTTTTTTTNRPRKKKKGGSVQRDPTMLEGRGGQRERDGYNRRTEVENRLI